MKQPDEVVFEIGEAVWRRLGGICYYKSTVTDRREIVPGRWQYALDNGPLRHRESGLAKLYKAV